MSAARRTLFVANRGEIALRVIRAARDLGLRSAAVASGSDRELPFAAAADELILLEGDGDREPYLDPAPLVAAALRARANLVHPGYGFLSESATFARAVAAAGLLWVGPSPETLEKAGDKAAARRAAERAGVPVLPGAEIPAGAPPRDIARAAARVGYPLLVKAVSGGGGRGIRRAGDEAELLREVEASSREALAAFGDGRFYLEREVPSPRHVEVQILRDARGRTALFPERDCSVQRRHQKVIEESPSPAVDAALRSRLQNAALQAAGAIGYANAGTVEFLLDGDGLFHFIEVNARLQVEHPVTELVAGVDLVAWQIRIALGEELPRALEGPIPASGHAIECRLTAESPPSFRPSAGELLLFRPPSGPGIRFDTGYREGNRVETRYDSLLAKLIAWGPDRAAALARLGRALDETAILGVETTVPFLADAIRHEAFRSGKADVDFLRTAMAEWSPPPPPPEALRIAEELALRGPHSRGASRVTAAESRGAARPGPWSAVRSLSIERSPA